MSRRRKQQCAKCGEPGYRYRGDRWLCIIHHRFDTMVTSAKSAGKTVPTCEQLEVMAKAMIEDGMRCPHCRAALLWARPVGDRKSLAVVSLQHDRSGAIRFLCMLCNLRHDDFPGDSFYDCPADHKFCTKCKTIKPLKDFPDWKVKSGKRWPPHCRVCQKETSRLSWAKYSASKRS